MGKCGDLRWCEGGVRDPAPTVRPSVGVRAGSETRAQRYAATFGRCEGGVRDPPTTGATFGRCEGGVRDPPLTRVNAETFGRCEGGVRDPRPTGATFGRCEGGVRDRCRDFAGDPRTNGETFGRCEGGVRDRPAQLCRKARVMIELVGLLVGSGRLGLGRVGRARQGLLRLGRELVNEQRSLGARPDGGAAVAADRSAGRRDLAQIDTVDLFELVQVPEPQLVGVIVRRKQLTPSGETANQVTSLGWPVKLWICLPVVEIPDPNGLVKATGDHAFAVGQEADAGEQCRCGRQIAG